ncbi:hypothetical protein MAPG_00107 [Magnaporthiopsis poae ATCC 64411]|uniref:Protein kinase domain-containing protein n=1 Tax=Magnaporthiopsis poae (strain ATCC 64411 / 73-15) TaxID=644358 RepID=A0A0C4DK45_MAGP6|nr:hypothetical protein MAPG_00107 [Magnaporthiopsis poae ATCC 64411]
MTNVQCYTQSQASGNLAGERCIVKSIRGHWGLQNEADVLRRHQSQTPFLRPLVNEICEPADPPSIVLRHLDSDALTESNRKRLSRPEIKQVTRSVLEALRGCTETAWFTQLNSSHLFPDVKLDNIFVNHGNGDQRFSEVQLGDCGGVVSQDGSFAREGHAIGAGYTRSLEATFQLSRNTATDIGSFGTAIRKTLVLGGGCHIFNPKAEGVKPDDGAYELTVVKRMYKPFGPFPESYGDSNDPTMSTIVDFIHSQGPPEKPFVRTGPREFPPADQAFILKIMKLDPRDRPTAEELLADPWFSEQSPDTRDPLPGTPSAFP